MAVTQYVGSRYVPLLADPMEWSSAKTYEPLTIVLHEGNSYTSRQFVPLGIDISNTSFWALTGNYNAQVEQYRRDVTALGTLLPSNEFSASNTVKDYVDVASGTAADAIGQLLPATNFSSTNTVKAYVDSSIADLDEKIASKSVEQFFVSDYKTVTNTDDDAFDACLTAADAYVGAPTVVIDYPLHITRSHIIKPQTANNHLGKRIRSNRPNEYATASSMTGYPSNAWDFIVDADNVTVLGINYNAVIGETYDTASDAAFYVEDIAIRNASGVETSELYTYVNKNVNAIQYSKCSLNVDGLITQGCYYSVFAVLYNYGNSENYLDFCTFKNIHVSYPQGIALKSLHNDNGIYENITVGYPSRLHTGPLISIHKDSNSYMNGLFIKLGAQPATDNDMGSILIRDSSIYITEIGIEDRNLNQLIRCSNSDVKIGQIALKFEIFPLVYCYDTTRMEIGFVTGRSINASNGNALFICRNATSFVRMTLPPKINYAEDVNKLVLYTYAGGNSTFDFNSTGIYDLRCTDSSQTFRNYVNGQVITLFDTITYDASANTVTCSGYKHIDGVPIFARCFNYRTGTSYRCVTSDGTVTIYLDAALTSSTLYLTLELTTCYKPV